MPKVTAVFSKLVHVAIRGEKRDDPTRYVRPDDGGVIKEFTDWCEVSGIDAHFVITSGGGSKVALYWEKDIPAIRQWLKDKGVEISPVYDDP